jgi:predicted metal-dependent phosphoesterase TrpH
LRVDLHAHSRHSGGGHFDIAGPPTGYASVEAIYRAAKRRGMDLVTLTDLDTIVGCLEFLDRRPDVSDFFISEEVTAMEPQSGSRLNVLVYDITEAEHEEIRRLRADVAELMSYLNAREIPSAMGLASIDAGADRWVDGVVGSMGSPGRFSRCSSATS